jgi:hypothetical protein
MFSWMAATLDGRIEAKGCRFCRSDGTRRSLHTAKGSDRGVGASSREASPCPDPWAEADIIMVAQGNQSVLTRSRTEDLLLRQPVTAS